MALALFRTESDQRINCPIRTNTQRFCLARAVHYQPAPHHPGTRQEPNRFICRSRRLVGWCEFSAQNGLDNAGEMSRLLRYLATSAERVAVLVERAGSTGSGE
jgi:hypothetical protein